MKRLCMLLGLALASSSTCLFSQVVYVTNLDSNSISAFTMNASSGALTAVPGSPFPTGPEPTGAVIDPTGKFLYLPYSQIFSNNGNLTGTVSISVYAINAASGALTAVQGSPFQTDANSGITLDPSGKFLYTIAAPSGISAFTVSAASGALTKIPGSTGDHFPTDSQVQGMAADPAGRFLYVATNNSLSVYRIDAGSGALTAIAGSSVKANFPRFGGASVTVHPTGKFVYACSLDGMLAYSVAAGTGALTAIQGSPFQLGCPIMDPQGKFAFTGSASGVSVFSVNPDSGAFTQVPGSPFPSQGGISAGAVDPSGKFFYAVNSVSVAAYAINATTGALTPVPGSPFLNAFLNIEMGAFVYSIAIHNLATPPAPLPVITSLAPSSATAGGA